MQGEGKYAFEVAKDANKTEIKKAIEAIFGVKVKKVNTIRLQGKLRRMGRSVGRRPEWKKAVITLMPGHSIKIFEGI